MDEIEVLAEVFKALSDPTRLRVVRLLQEHEGSLCVNALAHKVGVSQSAVSQHLRVLRHARLVHGARYGYHVHYTLDSEQLAEYRAKLREVLGDDFVIVR